MDWDSEKSGTRLFHQVNPSGGPAGTGRILKLVPGESVQTVHAPISSSVHAAKAPAIPPNATSRGQRASPATVQIPPPFSIKTLLPSSPPKSTATAVVPETLKQATQPAQSEVPPERTFVFAPESKNGRTVISGAIRTFSKVPRVPQRPGGPIQWVLEGSPSHTSVLSPANASEVLNEARKTSEARANGDDDPAGDEQPDFSVLMFDDKLFFRIEGKERAEGEAIDLCRDEVSNVGGTPADEDGVTFVSYTPAPAASGAEEQTRRCAETDQAPGGSSATPTDPTLAASGHEEQSGHSLQPQIPSGPSPAPRPEADRKLKQMFGITSELEIRLPRVVSCDAAFKVPPPDYTRPIEEDFLCAANPPHSRDCPQVEGSASRVGRTRKRTKCPCCSPAVLHRHRHDDAQKRRAKTGLAERRETVRRRLKLQPGTAGGSAPGATPETAPGTAPGTTTQIPEKKAKLKPPPLTTSMSSSETSPQIAKKQTKLKPTAGTEPETSPQIPKKQTKLQSTAGTEPETSPQIPKKQPKLQPTPETTPMTTTGTTPQSTIHIPQEDDEPPQSSPGTASLIPQKRPLTAPSTDPPTASQTSQTIPQRTTPGTTPETTQTLGADADADADADPEEVQIHREIERLREALRLQEAALEKLQSDRNR